MVRVFMLCEKYLAILAADVTIATHHLNREWKRVSGGFDETLRHVKTNPGILCQHMEKVMRTGGLFNALPEIGFDIGIEIEQLAHRAAIRKPGGCSRFIARDQHAGPRATADERKQISRSPCRYSYPASASKGSDEGEDLLLDILFVDDAVLHDGLVEQLADQRGDGSLGNPGDGLQRIDIMGIDLACECVGDRR